MDTGSLTASMFTHHDQMDVRAASQRLYLTPTSSGSSLPRLAAPAAAQPAQVMELATLSSEAAGPRSNAESGDAAGAAQAAAKAVEAEA